MFYYTENLLLLFCLTKFQAARAKAINSIFVHVEGMLHTFH